MDHAMSKDVTLFIQASIVQLIKTLGCSKILINDTMVKDGTLQQKINTAKPGW